jgi:hypothetical protein
LAPRTSRGILDESPDGAVAQLGEHLLCKEGVRSSSLLGSTNASRPQAGGAIPGSTAIAGSTG